MSRIISSYYGHGDTRAGEHVRSVSSIVLLSGQGGWIAFTLLLKVVAVSMFCRAKGHHFRVGPDMLVVQNIGFDRAVERITEVTHRKCQRENS
jgi:hypothetical protein